MNRISLRSLICFAALCMLFAALGINAAAQDILPLPQVGTPQIEGRFSASPDQVEPADLSPMISSTEFRWLDTGALRYKLVFTEVLTGIKHVQKVQTTHCNGTVCSFVFGNSPFFDTLSDDMQLTWKVVAIHEDSKIKSGIRTVTLNEVVQPTLDNPNSGANLGYTGTLSWTNANAINDYVRVVIVDPVTGAKALNQYVDAQSCSSICSITPRHFTGKLVIGKTYEWFVVAYGMTGEPARSETRTINIVP